MNEVNEIEVKAKLRNKDTVLKYLNDKGVVLEKKYQKDTVYFPNDVSADLKDKPLGKNFLRIRSEEKNGLKRFLFTLKQPKSNQTDKLEYEIEVLEKDLGILDKMIQVLGYYPFVTTEKTRESGKLNDFDVCIDEVKDLGMFIELEKFGPGHLAPRIQEELYNVLHSWGIGKEDFVYYGYDVLVHEAKNKKL